jgi:hypothetical protein
MKRQIIYSKMEYYCKWYISMSKEEKETELGQWILERLDWYYTALLS